jgi:hypothetical protein
MNIAELLQSAGIEPRYGEINLGTVNGWTESTHTLYNALREYRVDNTGTERNLGRCYNEYSFSINDGTDEFVVVYSVDSSD